MFGFYEFQKINCMGAVCISLQKSRFAKQRKACFVANLAAPYREIQITLLETGFHLLAAETMNASLGGFSNKSTKLLCRYGVVSPSLLLGRIVPNFGTTR